MLILPSTPPPAATSTSMPPPAPTASASESSCCSTRPAGSGAEVWLVCPQQTQLDASSQIGEVLGKQTVDALRKHQPVQIDGVRLVAYTERQLPHAGTGSPVVAIHTDAQLLDKLDALVQVPSLVVVPWNPETDTRAWREKRNPEVLSPREGTPE